MQILFFNKKSKLLFTSLLVAVVLFWSLVSGVKHGQSSAQSKVVYENQENLNKGLEFFYSDQGRFPSLAEYTDINVMLYYFNSFPPANIESANCPTSFVYKRISTSSYNLNYCLSSNYKNGNTGWNTINGNK